MIRRYCVSWSPRTGEATYFRMFDSEEERTRFINGIAAASVHTWENDYSA